MRLQLKDGYSATITSHRLYATVELQLGGKVVATTTSTANGAKMAAELLMYRHQCKKVPQVKVKRRKAREEQ